MTYFRSVGQWAVLLVTFGALPPAQAQDRKPDPLPDKVVAAWQKAGAQAGWLGRDRYGFPKFRHGGAGKPGEMPSFRLKPWQPGSLAQLPQPPEPFGLDLSNTKVNDADLKELVQLKQLRTLYLSGTLVTGAGLKELAPLQQLQSLNLRTTQVTDADLKQLAPFKQLRDLELGGNRQLTDAALKELAPLQQLQSLGLFFTQVTDVGLKDLAQFQHLRSLSRQHYQDHGRGNQGTGRLSPNA